MPSITSITATPNSTVILPLNIFDGYGGSGASNPGSLMDGYTFPTLDWILLPSGNYAAGFPQTFNRIQTGIYKISIVIPGGITAVGSYICSASYPDPVSNIFQNHIYLINVGLPFGNSTVSPM